MDFRFFLKSVNDPGNAHSDNVFKFHETCEHISTHNLKKKCMIYFDALRSFEKKEGDYKYLTVYGHNIGEKIQFYYFFLFKKRVFYKGLQRFDFVLLLLFEICIISRFLYYT